MPRMVRRTSWLLVVGALGTMAITGDAATPSQVQESRLTGSGRISGRVIAADDGKPVRRAEVHLMGHPDADPDHVRLVRKVESDLNGRFEFIDLPVGDYAILFNQLTGFVVPSGYTKARLTDRQAVDVTIRLERTGAIEGRILDQDDDPVLGAQVMAVERIDIAGYVSWGTRQASARTNDRGEFRIFHLAPGDYFLVASKRYDGGMHAPPPPPIGPVTTYFPGSTLRADARAVTVRPGQDTTSAPFKLARRNLATLSIAAIDSRGATLGSEAAAHLRMLDALDLFSSTPYAIREGGDFVFRGLEPGVYSLVVSTSYKQEEQAYAKVSIDQSSVSLKMQTNTGARVSGRVIVDGQPAKGANELPYAWVSARTPSRTYGVSYSHQPNIRLEGSNRFELTGLRGPLQLSGDVTYGKLVSMQRGGEELSGKIIDFTGTETLDDVVVELTTRVAKLEVIVPRSINLREPVVFIFPEDRQRWRPGLAFQAAVPYRDAVDQAAAGTTSTLPMLPGRYLVVAINTGAVVDSADPALLEKLVPLATRVTLAADETTKITIPIANAQR